MTRRQSLPWITQTQLYRTQGEDGELETAILLVPRILRGVVAQTQGTFLFVAPCLDSLLSLVSSIFLLLIQPWCRRRVALAAMDNAVLFHPD